MQNNQTVGLSLEEQALALATLCAGTERCPSGIFDGHCPKGISGLDMRSGRVGLCYAVSEIDWLEFLKNRQISVDNPAK